MAPNKAASTKRPIYGIVSAIAVPAFFIIAFVFVEAIRSSSNCATPLALISIGTVGAGALIALVTGFIAIFRKGESRNSRILGIIGVIASLATVVGGLSLFYRR